jgi:inosine-uridine nucleoside N-ribohydrolase
LAASRLSGAPTFALSVRGGVRIVSDMYPRPLLVLLGCALLTPLAAAAERFDPAPVIFDTDIGTDIDDAYALAQLMQSPELKLIGVTTVSGDAVARARLAAKLLAIPGDHFASVPVYAGISTAPQQMLQCDWAKGYTSPALHESGGVAFMRDQINAQPGQITIIAVGELTNVAALLESDPAIAKKIKAIALMGGAVRRGYDPGKPPEAEWNIRSNTKAAQTVFRSGVPLIVCPLDSTTTLKLAPEYRVRIFSASRPLNDALAALDFIWLHTNHWKGTGPTLFDALPIALVARPNFVPLTPLHIGVDDTGMTVEVAGKAPNAQVALTSDVPAFMEYFTGLLTRP